MENEQKLFKCVFATLDDRELISELRTMCLNKALQGRKLHLLIEPTRSRFRPNFFLQISSLRI